MRGKYSRKQIGLIIGEELVSIRGMNELRFLHKIEVHKVLHSSSLINLI